MVSGPLLLREITYKYVKGREIPCLFCRHNALPQLPSFGFARASFTEED